MANQAPSYNTPMFEPYCPAFDMSPLVEGAKVLPYLLGNLIVVA